MTRANIQFQDNFSENTVTLYRSPDGNPLSVVPRLQELFNGARVVAECDTLNEDWAYMLTPTDDGFGLTLSIFELQVDAPMVVRWTGPLDECRASLLAELEGA